ncbi:MAG TPA: hypothetical protein PLG17_08115 [Thermodesulfobacteriota bacterium]|mgnify:FL=1|nr:hypothetical protein [Deltaproteobacteria bacterium]HNR13253.1 hypothetical protein [Thermodesulfobacteriota bacterium]HOC39021.1 hypothetical protein [Thermodesulfobacteriota bacterium]HQO78464.1 hypothetical protein [Thermodesulfobacteriota bacterium]
MITIPDLQTSLLDLLYEIEGSDIKLIIGGGFGIYLKMEHVKRLGIRTLLEEWPEARSTNDIDLFLRAEVLIESARLKPLAEAIDRLGYRVVPGAEKYQFVKPGPRGDIAGSIKIDILTGPQTRFRATRAKVDARRVRPSPSVGIHAHPVDEAPTLEDGLLPVFLRGKLTSGNLFNAEVFIPHPYTYLMMKLFAFRDRLNDSTSEFGRYHALDLYSILATTSEEEWRHSLVLRDQYRSQPYVSEAGDLVFEYFSTPNRLGMVRLRESAYYRPELQLDEFVSALQELFPLAADNATQR